MKLIARLLVVSSLVAVLAGCSTFDTRSGRASARAGGYYKDDGPGANPPANLADIPDAVPKAEPLNSGTSRPYTVMGRDYVPMTDASGFRQEGLASWYGKRFQGKPTASGEPYDMYAMTAAHPTLPIPSYARVTNLENGNSVIVRINDRGPFHSDRIIDVSYTAAWKLDILKGVTPVQVEALDPDAPDAGVVATPWSSFRTRPEAAGATYLQLGAFSSAANAEAFAEHVRQRLAGRLPGIESLQADDLYKVQTGPFQSVSQADLAAETVMQTLGVVPFKVAR